MLLSSVLWSHSGGIKAGESRGRAPGQASDYVLWAPNPLDNSTMNRCFIKISGPPIQSGPQVFPPPAPPRLAGHGWHMKLSGINVNQQDM